MESEELGTGEGTQHDTTFDTGKSSGGIYLRGKIPGGNFLGDFRIS